MDRAADNLALLAQRRAGREKAAENIRNSVGYPDVSAEEWNKNRQPGDAKASKIVRAPGIDSKFYGHFLPSHFKKTRIIGTRGRA